MDSVSILQSNGAADWFKNRGPVWNRIWLGRGTSSFDSSVPKNVGIGWRVEGKSNFSLNGLPVLGTA